MVEGLVVLDAWPIVEYYQGREPAVSAVAELLRDRSRSRVMSVVNFTEVCSAIAVGIGADAAARVARHLRRLVVLESATSDIAEVAARLKHAYYMALGDTFAVATAISHGAPVWTGDAEILCADRFWPVADLRSDAAKRLHAGRADRFGRRPAVAHLPDRQLIDYVAAPLRGATTRPADSA